MAQLGGVLRQRLFTVLGIAAGVLGISLGYSWQSELEFQARARLFLGELVDADSEYRRAQPGVLDGVSGELEILQSQALVEAALLRAGLNVNVEPAQGRAPRYIDWFLANHTWSRLERKAEDLSITGARGEASAGTYVVEFTSEREYQLWSGPNRLGQGQLGSALRVPGLEWTLAAGRVSRPRAGARYEVALTPLDVALAEARQRLRVVAPRANGSIHYGRIVMLEFTDGSPARAQSFLAALLDGYLERRRERKLEQINAGGTLVGHELGAARQALDGAERQLAYFRADHRTLWFEDEHNPLLRELRRYRAEQADAELELSQLLELGRGISGTAEARARLLRGESSDAQLRALGSALSEADQQLREITETYGAAATEVHEQQRRVDGRVRAIKNYVEGRAQRVQAHLDRVEALLGELERKLGVLESSQLELAALTQSQAFYADAYSRLLDQERRAALVRASNVSKDRIIDAPILPRQPSSPGPWSNLPSGLFGLLLGVEYVLWQTLGAQGAREAKRVAPGARRHGIVA